MWKDHFKPPPASNVPIISAEMRESLGNWINENYGIHPGAFDFDCIRDNRAKLTISLGARGLTEDASFVEFVLSPDGHIQCALLPSTGKRVDLQPGRLPPSKEAQAQADCEMTQELWLNRPIGWHPSLSAMLECLQSMAKTADVPFNAVTVAGFYPDGEMLSDSCTTFAPTIAGVAQALAFARAMLKGGQAYLAQTPIELDEGNMLLTIYPSASDDCGPLDTGEWLTADPTNYADWTADMPVTHPNDNNDKTLRHWANVMPLNE